MSKSIRITRFAVGVVIAAAIGAALFRVVTANDRVAERRNIARAVCANSEGVDEMIYVASLVARIRASASQTHASGAQLDRSWCAMSRRARSFQA